MSRRAIGKGDGEAASQRELERRNVVLVWGFVQGQWGGTRHQGSSIRKKKDFSDLRFFTYVPAKSCFWKHSSGFDGPWV